MGTFRINLVSYVYKHKITNTQTRNIYPWGIKPEARSNIAVDYSAIVPNVSAPNGTLEDNFDLAWEEIGFTLAHSLS